MHHCTHAPFVSFLLLVLSFTHEEMPPTDTPSPEGFFRKISGGGGVIQGLVLHFPWALFSETYGLAPEN